MYNCDLLLRNSRISYTIDGKQLENEITHLKWQVIWKKTL